MRHDVNVGSVASEIEKVRHSNILRSIRLLLCGLINVHATSAIRTDSQGLVNFW